MDKKIEILKDIASNRNILIVEDDVELNGELNNLLGMFFKDVYCAYDGEEGLKIYEDKENEIDLIITDINMPKMDGLEMLRHIKYINKDQNCLVLSAYSDLKYVLQIVELGVNQFIPKPYDIDDFIAKTTKIMEVTLLEESNRKKADEILILNSELTEKNKALQLKSEEALALAQTLENFLYNPNFDQKKFLQTIDKKREPFIDENIIKDDDLLDIWL